MTTTADQIVRRGSAVACGLTLDRYVETLMPRYGSNTLRRSTRQGHHTMEREDLVNEAAVALTEVWNKYAHLKPEGEVRRMGTRAIYFHVGNLYHHLRSFGAKDATMVYPEHYVDGGRGVCPIERHQAKHYGRVEPQLESLIARESIETLSVPDFRGPSADAVRKIFSDVARAVREGDGYSLVEAAGKLNYNQRGEVRMNGGVTAGPESPDVQRFSEVQQAIHDEATKATKAPKAKVAKVAKAPKAKAAAKVARLTRSDADARVATFKPGQRVRYKGGGRAPDLKAGALMTVLGSVKSKGRMYLRLALAGGRLVGMSGALVSKI